MTVEPATGGIVIDEKVYLITFNAVSFCRNKPQLAVTLIRDAIPFISYTLSND